MKIWFTLTGTRHYQGDDFLEKGMKIRLEKEPDNKHDREAGRLYDRIGDTAKAKVFAVTEKGVLCRLETEKNPKPESAKGAAEE